jgi:hypothetical protein
LALADRVKDNACSSILSYQELHQYSLENSDEFWRREAHKYLKVMSPKAARMSWLSEIEVVMSF